jgi:peptidoglycan/LPS O-acetylase OafA/YrhL
VRAFAVIYITVPVGLLCGLIATQLNAMALPRPLIELQSQSLSFLYPTLLISTIFHPRHWFSRLLEWEPLRFVGRLSYSLYLWQELFLTDNRAFPGPIHYLQGPFTSLGALSACALASYFLVEKPMIRLGQRLTGQRNAVPARQPLPPVAEPV